MFGNSSRINPLESRKRLLIAESELNRAQLVGDVAALTAEIHTLAERAKSFGSVASSAAQPANRLFSRIFRHPAIICFLNQASLFSQITLKKMRTIEKK